MGKKKSKKSKKKNSKLLFCNEQCKGEYKDWSKDNKIAKLFGLMAASQKRCSFCGNMVKIRKKVKEV